ncbi:hypothetical protein CAPTEDRAFT_20314 [Capitella teleta]|uniref:Uncharacterized protein n=1 Tax=Capitella teleta TaxID=283909 RepID=R7VLL6_CAPTE|nr:hypothetical protein CAPTEDRAFT_20314 [Capitella teleta]|eukprot:ELU18406.1 hypothetical protein CAPTEDRAFT_20314 [Capitella teleta]
MAANSIKVPAAISFDSIVEDICCHPSRDVIAAGSIDGDVTIHSYSTEEQNHLLMTLPHHKKACRAVRFSPGGNLLLSASKDKSISVVDVDQGKVIKSIPKAHGAALYCLEMANEDIVATGDDDGYLKLWDLRQKPKAVMELKENEEFISDIHLEFKRKMLLMTSGDGTLTAVDIRKHKMKMQSELFESELLSLTPVKGSKKIACGSGDGAINFFNWGEWGNMSDRFPGHPVSIDCMVTVTDDIICTGSMDGFIRAVHVLPNRFVGVIGEHDEFPVENLSLSHCRQFVTSCSHDQTIKFWDVSDLDQVEIDTSKKAKKSSRNTAVQRDDFFAGLEDDKEEDEDEEEEEEEEEESEESSSSDEAESNKR